MLKRSKRIHGRLLVAQLLKEGLELSGPFFVLRGSPGLKPHPRYAVLVGKKAAPLACDRNHKRRQIYSILHEWDSKKALGEIQNFDMIVLARKPALKASHEDLKTTLIAQLDRLISELLFKHAERPHS